MKYVFVSLLVLLAALFYAGLSTVREFYKIQFYKGRFSQGSSLAHFDPEKKNVFLIADNKGTENFDLIAPFYLFNLTGRANVYIIAPEISPIPVTRGFFALPHYTLTEIDSLKIVPAVIVIPRLSDKKHQDPYLVRWIKGKYSDSTKILSVCAGSFTAASTGLYDGKEMTTHASDMKDNKKLFAAPKWVEGVSFTRNGNLYSTAGISNAVEGTLSLICDLFGEVTMMAVMEKVNYPHSSLKRIHASIPITSYNKVSILKKVLFSVRTDIGVLMTDGIDEFQLSAVLDAYHRTFPSSLKTFVVNQGSIRTKFGLTLLPTGAVSEMKDLEELHVFSPGSLNKGDPVSLDKLSIVNYDPVSKDYIFDKCLKRIAAHYGSQMHAVVKRLLDYN